MTRLFFALVTLTFAFATAPARAGDELKATIQALEDQWSAAFNASDAAAVAAFYEEDAAFLAPGMEPVHGREAIAALLPNFFPVLSDLKLVADKVIPMGDDYVMEIGHSDYNAVGEDGALTPGNDNYVVIWHKGEDGTWRYATDIFNTR